MQTQRVVCLAPGCGALFTPREDQEYHSPACERRALLIRDRIPASVGKGSPAFWYEVLDTIHFFHLGLPVVYLGKATIHRYDWVRIFYRDEGGNDAGARGWDRFKSQARKLSLIAAVEDPLFVHETAAGFIHIDIARAYDGAFEVLGSPHHGGEAAEEAYKRARRGEPRRAEESIVTPTA